jgi:hypothetical protein
MPDNNSEDKKTTYETVYIADQNCLAARKMPPIKLSVIAARRHSKWLRSRRPRTGPAPQKIWNTPAAQSW